MDPMAEVEGAAPVRSRIVTILRNFGFLVSGKLLGDAVTFAMFVLISRRFGQEGIGIYSFAIAFTGIFAVLSEAGANSFTLRELAHDDDYHDRLSEIFTLRVWLALGASALLAAVLPFLPFESETLIIIVLIAGYQLAYQGIMGFAAVSLARGHALGYGAFEGSFRALTASGAIVVALSGADLRLTLATLPIIAAGLILLGYGFIARRWGRPRWVTETRRLAGTARELLPYGLSVVLVQVHQRLDVTLLGLLLGATLAGVYNVAYRVVFLLLFFPYLMGTSVIPLASRLHAEDAGELRELFQRFIRVAVLISVPAAAGIVLIARDLILLVFGDAFLESVPLLQLLGWLFMLVCPRAILSAFLVACGRQAERSRAQAWALLCALALNLVLIPTYGTVGAAVATLAAETLLIVLLMARLQPETGWPRIASRLALAGFGSATFYGLFSVVPAQPLWVTIGGAVLLYGLILLMFPPVRRELRAAVQAFRATSTAGASQPEG